MAGPRSSVHTPALSTPDSVTPRPGSARPHRTLLLRPRGLRRPKPDDAERFKRTEKVHAYGRRRALDVIDAGLAASARGDPVPVAELADETPIYRRTSDGRIVATSRGAEARTWLARLAANMADCDHVLVFRHAPCGRYTKPRPIACHSRVDPSCEALRAADLAGRILALLDDVPRRRRSYLVMTLRNTFDLAAGYKAMSTAWGRLRARPVMKGGRCRQRTRDGSPFHPCRPAYCKRAQGGKGRRRHRGDRNCPDFRHAPVKGGVAIDEVTFHKCRAKVYDRATKIWGHRVCDPDCPWVGSWHPHLNVLMDAPYIPQAELADAWREVTCPDHRGRGCPRDCDAGSSIVWIEGVDPGTVREAVKYVTKPADLVDDANPWPMLEFLLASRGRRLVRGFGSFYNVDFERDPADEVEKVKLQGEVIAHDRAGRDVYRTYTLDRYPECCGADSLLPGGAIAYDLPIRVPRDELVKIDGRVTWYPPRPRPHPRR